MVNNLKTQDYQWYYVYDTKRDSYTIINQPKMGQSTIVATNVPTRSLAQKLCSFPDMYSYVKECPTSSRLDNILVKAEGPKR